MQSLSTAHVTVVDYGVGNILNVERALRHIGMSFATVNDVAEIPQDTDLLILPGVGAFGASIEELKNKKLFDYVYHWAHIQKKPLVGICLGMQMLFSKSFEMGEHIGLNLIPGQVKKIPLQHLSSGKYPVPHVGWSNLHFNSSSFEKGAAYFVHSYFVTDMPDDYLMSYCMYGDIQVPAIVGKENILGFQFHPEKSGEYGLMLLKKYIEQLLR